MNTTDFCTICVHNNRTPTSKGDQSLVGVSSPASESAASSSLSRLRRLFLCFDEDLESVSESSPLCLLESDLK